MSNGEIRETPGRMGPQVEGAGGGAELERRFLEERGREQVAFLTELLRDPTTVPEVGTVLVRGEFLVPAEKGGMDISNFEAEPLLKELLKRAGAPAQQEQLAEILKSQKGEANGETEDLERTIQEAREAGSSDEALKELRKRLAIARRAEKTGRILQLRIGEISPEEAEKWLGLYEETKARVRLEQSWKQRVTAATASTKMYAEELFSAAFTAVYPSSSELATIFEIPEIGVAADLALETYLDVHLNRGEYRRRGKSLGVEEKEGKLFVVEAKEKLEEQIKTEKDEGRKKALEDGLEKIGKWEREKTLQAGESILVDQEEVADFVRKSCGSDKSWVQESAETLARHYLEFDLTSNWLAVPRDKEGNIDYSQAKKGKKGDFNIGFGLLEGDTQPMGSIWLVLTRLKYLSELSKDRPVGPPALAPGMPEYLAKPLLKFMEVRVDKEGKPHLPSEKPPKGEKWEKKPILEAWYFENKRREEEGYKQSRLPLAEFLKCVSEDTITYWAYCLFRQSLVRNALVEGDREKMLAELWMPEALRSLGKSFQVAFGGRLLEREITKINLVASRILIWTDELFADKKIRERNLEVTREDKKKTEIPNPKNFLLIVKKSCRISGFLNEKIWPMVEQVIRERKAIIPSRLTKEEIAVLLRYGEEPPLTRATGKKDLAEVIREIEDADKRVTNLQIEINKEINKKKKEEGKKRELTLNELSEVARVVVTA